VSEDFVQIHNLCKSFSSQLPLALKGIEATIPKGEIVGLIGPDGAGKTTLIRLIAGLLLPSQGSIRVGGYDSVKDANMIHYLTGYMPQKFGLYEDLTVFQNLDLYANLSGICGKERSESFQKLLKFTGLEPFTRRLAGALSGGMKQKLGLACSLIRKPMLLLLDEPSVGVDPVSRRELWKMVQDLLKEGITIVWSTSYLDEAEECNTVLLLNEGKLLYYGKPQDLTKKVAQRVFQITNIQTNRRQILSELLKKKNIVDGVIQGKNVRFVIQNPKEPLTLKDLQIEKELKIEPIPPRFEDAFIDLLGGAPKGESELAKITPSINNKSKKIIITESLTKKFGSFTAASQISFQIQRGEIFGLLGPNGAGKSTTFKMMCGLLKPTEGKAYVNELDLQKAPGKARAQIGYMAQKFSLYGSLSVRQNLEFFSGAYNLSGGRQTEAINKMVEIFGLNQYLNTSAESLPLGYKQRLALSCSCMHHPEVLFLDEPTSGVDPITRREFWSHINGIVEKGVTVMVTTHFMDEAEYCDRIALIYRSRMIYVGSPDDLKEMTKTPENPNPTLKDAFIKLIEEYDAKNPL
jgi:ABC-2 type transport system ATP-binding protein